MPQRTDPIERFWPKVNKTDTCWLWTASRMGLRRNYGAFSWNGRTSGAHRFAYLTFVGPIPDGYDIDHTCHVEHCVRPDHLHAVTKQQNQQNRKGATANSTSGVRGVTWLKRDKRWLVQVHVKGKSYYGGRFTDLAAAERAAVALRNRLMTHNLVDRRLAA
jgi:hypothetical protein